MPNDTLTVATHRSIADICKEVWDNLAGLTGQPYYPFTAFDFLDALEKSGSVRPETGWGPQHLVLSDGDNPIGALPLYLKGHSQGEYIFDHAWAEAYQRAGGRYYPKLLAAIPFTPATGPRLLCRPETQATLAAAAAQVSDEMGVSSLHLNFPDKGQVAALEVAGYLIRKGQQFHFTDEGFGDWGGFLAALSSRKRKDLRKERAAIAQSDLDIEWITGRDITEDHLDHFWTFYQDTGARKWGTPYLTRTFFSMVTERMADRMLFVFAKRGDRPIAGALNFIGGDTLFGRYWGCTEHVPFLHFELCYYQAIDYALAHGLTHVDAGAQGEHKIARGYRPSTIYSAHVIRDEGFRQAVAQYLEAEATEVDAEINYLGEFTPFRRG
ncbi:GNAT family N-acetyltransferase [Parvularcula sp. LCG005]|uniref:GNAT family N-acetyltransferase n=1 Tax=Parvularcula sp. LCG005 TaxID=3078805 RepID=UPI002941E26F|nr:GNAT family N-acetyltransferase [Parvularcula sp. LCG005]WOI52370.1 GNAT family N-acetyltransferase [Parvularcula sp. LCG005]